MTRATMVTAIREGIPFVISMADGREYEVHDNLEVALGPANAVVLDKGGSPHLLPLLTMTGIACLPVADGASAH